MYCNSTSSENKKSIGRIHDRMGRYRCFTVRQEGESPSCMYSERHAHKPVCICRLASVSKTLSLKATFLMICEGRWIDPFRSEKASEGRRALNGGRQWIQIPCHPAALAGEHRKRLQGYGHLVRQLLPLPEDNMKLLLGSSRIRTRARRILKHTRLRLML